MPYIPKRDPELTMLIRAYGFNGERLQSVLGHSPPTNRKLIQNPDQLTVADLKNLARKGHIPLDEIRAAIKI